jgi:hypothetical protein
MECLGYFFWFLTDKGRGDALPVLRRTPPLGEVKQSLREARRTIAVIIAFRKCNKNSLERRGGDYRSSRDKIPCSYILFFFVKWKQNGEADSTWN